MKQSSVFLYTSINHTVPYFDNDHHTEFETSVTTNAINGPNQFFTNVNNQILLVYKLLLQLKSAMR